MAARCPAHSAGLGEEEATPSLSNREVARLNKFGGAGKVGAILKHGEAHSRHCEPSRVTDLMVRHRGARVMLGSGRFSGEGNVGAIPKHGEVHSRSRCQAGRV